MNYTTMRLEKEKVNRSFGFLWGYQGRDELKNYFELENKEEQKSHVVNYYVDLAIYFGFEKLVLDEINELILDTNYNVSHWDIKHTKPMDLPISEHTIEMITKLEGGI